MTILRHKTITSVTACPAFNKKLQGTQKDHTHTQKDHTHTHTHKDKQKHSPKKEQL